LSGNERTNVGGIAQTDAKFRRECLARHAFDRVDASCQIVIGVAHQLSEDRRIGGAEAGAHVNARHALHVVEPRTNARFAAPHAAARVTVYGEPGKRPSRKG